MPEYVSAYAVTRNYGGPEEGGWWYDWYEHLETRPIPHPAVTEVIRTSLREKHADEEYGDIYSVRGGVLVRVMLEDEPHEFESTERPYYS